MILPKAILFDLDGTLLDRERMVEALAVRLCAGRGESPAAHAGALAAAIRAADPEGDRAPRAVCAALCDGRLPWLGPADASSLVRGWRDAYASTACARDGAAGLLDALRARGVRLGLISNGRADVQRRKLAVAGLGPCFDAIAISGEHGIRKPDRRLFHLALRRLDAAPSDAWHVGDHPRCDVVGARDAGLRAIWFRCGRVWPADLGPAPTTLDRLRDLLHPLGLARQ